MNRVCPNCGFDFASGYPEGGTVPYEENDKIGTLHFCSVHCKARFKHRER